MPATQQEVVYQQLAGNSPALQTGYNGPPSHHDEGAQWKELLLWSRCWSRPFRGLTQRRLTHSLTHSCVPFVLARPMRMCTRLSSPLAKSVVRSLVATMTSLQMSRMRERLQ
jgi:hypothetical protein